MRGRHWWDMIDGAKARDNYRLASSLFPQSRLWRQKAVQAALYANTWFKESGAMEVVPASLANSVTFGIGCCNGATFGTDNGE